MYYIIFTYTSHGQTNHTVDARETQSEAMRLAVELAGSNRVEFVKIEVIKDPEQYTPEVQEVVGGFIVTKGLSVIKWHWTGESWARESRYARVYSRRFIADLVRAELTE